MTKEILENFRKCEVDKTYYVEGVGKSDNLRDNECYWYFFKCTDISKNNIEGSDIFDWENNKYQDWTMSLAPSEDIDVGVGVTLVRKLSIEEFRNSYPEHFL